MRRFLINNSYRSVYESSRIATELSELRKKLNSLYEVKNSLKAGGDSANMELLSKAFFKHVNLKKKKGPDQLIKFHFIQ